MTRTGLALESRKRDAPPLCLKLGDNHRDRDMSTGNEKDEQVQAIKLALIFSVKPEVG